MARKGIKVFLSMKPPVFFRLHNRRGAGQLKLEFSFSATNYEPKLLNRTYALSLSSFPVYAGHRDLANN